MSDSARMRRAPVSTSLVIRRLLLVGAGTAAIVGCTWIFLRGTRERVPVAVVAQSLCDAATVGARADAPLGAGQIGPWSVAAGSADSVRGRLVDFRLESGTLRLAAREAQIFVSPEDDAFGFELVDVVFARVEDENVPAEERDDAFLHHKKSYVLGPVPFGADVVADGSSIPRAPTAPPHSGQTLDAPAG
jgi:hypothetical protein